MVLNFNFITKYQDMIIDGWITTLEIVVLSMILGFFIGLGMALLQRSQNRVLRIISTVWVDVLRNTPFLIQLFFFYYGLPELGIDTNPLVVSVIALGINTSAGNCEVIRSGLLAVKKGYYECAAALGYTKVQTYRFFVIPLALRVAFKSLVNNFVNLALTSSVCHSITVMETMGVAKTIVGQNSRPFEVYLLLLVEFCVFTYVISFICKFIDRKIHVVL